MTFADQSAKDRLAQGLVVLHDEDPHRLSSPPSDVPDDEQ
jgi:hypothetical protein